MLKQKVAERFADKQDPTLVCLPGCKRGHCAQTDRQTGAERLNPPPTDNPPHTNNPGTSQKDLMPPFLNDVVFLAFWVIFVGWNKTNHSSHVLPPIWETRPWWVGDTQTTVDLVVALFGIAPKVHRCAHCVHALRSRRTTRRRTSRTFPTCAAC